MSTETQEYVIFQETPRDYRTEIPNIVFELLEAGYISPADFTLYSTYRRIAGQNGACWFGTRALAKKCGLSHPTIASSKKTLSQPLKILGGKSLIHITPCNRKLEKADTITIIDIWPENFRFFKKSLTCEKREHGGVQKDDTRVCKKTTHKKEPYKKEPYKNPPLSSPPPEEPKPKESPPKPKTIPPKLPKKSLRSEEEDFSICKELEATTLSPKEKRRLTQKYTTEQIVRALKHAEGQPIKKSLMGLLVNILDNPHNWEDAPAKKPLSAQQQEALKYNLELAKVDPKMAKENEKLMEQGAIKVITVISGREVPMQLSMKALDFLSDVKDAKTWLTKNLKN